MPSDFLQPARLATRAEILSPECPVPKSPGVYGWWFRELPTEIDVGSCAKWNGLVLLYTGISPTQRASNGPRPSSENLRSRIRTHYTRDAEGSTLRKTLGCLLSARLGIELRRIGTGKRMTFAQGESVLSAWMGENALVSWVVHEQPWELEQLLIGSLDVPLNLQGNARNAFHPILTRVRSEAVARARALPVLPSPG